MAPGSNWLVQLGPVVAQRMDVWRGEEEDEGARGEEEEVREMEELTTQASGPCVLDLVGATPEE